MPIPPYGGTRLGSRRVVAQSHVDIIHSFSEDWESRTRETQGWTTHNIISVGAQASICRCECPEWGLKVPQMQNYCFALL